MNPGNRFFRKRGVRGAVAVELAAVLVLLVLLMIGFINASAAWRMKHVLTKASREGARIASVTPNLQVDDPVVLQVADEVMQKNGINPETAQRSVSFEAPLESGDPITVTVKLQFEPIVGGSLLKGGQPLLLGVSSVMRYQSNASDSEG